MHYKRYNQVLLLFLQQIHYHSCAYTRSTICKRMRINRPLSEFILPRKRYSQKQVRIRLSSELETVNERKIHLIATLAMNYERVHIRKADVCSTSSTSERRLAKTSKY